MCFQIGKLEIKGRAVLGPMAGVTDLPFRLLCKEQGAALLYTEMVSAKALLYQNRNTRALLATNECEQPIAVQLFGSEPALLAEAARMLEEQPFAMVDINMGCPVPKVVNNGEGSALMKTPEKIGAIVAAVKAATHKPVTVKLRSGFTEETKNAVVCAKIAEANGADAVAVHGRTRQQYYSGTADYESIRQVKAAVRIPVIGSGDVYAPQDAARMLAQTGCDAVMLARGARGNPWLFAAVNAYLRDGTERERPSFSCVRQMVERHARLLTEEKERQGLAAAEAEYAAMREMRKHVAWYTTGYPHAARLRARVNAVSTAEELRELLFEYAQAQTQN